MIKENLKEVLKEDLKEDSFVEVYKGKSIVRTVYRDIIKEFQKKTI